MMDVFSLKAKKVRMLVLVGLCFSAVYWISVSGPALEIPTLPFVGKLRRFYDISVKSVEIAKNCLDQFLFVFKKQNASLLLFDLDILPRIFEAHQKSWHAYVHVSRNSSNNSSEERNVITFAIQHSQFKDKKKTIIKDLRSRGFALNLSFDIDTRLPIKNNTVRNILTHVWAAKHDYVIHVTVLYERKGGYFWMGPVSRDELEAVAIVLAPALAGGRQTMERIGVRFQPYARAFEKSDLLHDLTLAINGYDVKVPYNIPSFLDEYKNSHFIECDYARAAEYKKTYEKSLTAADQRFIEKSKKLLLDAKRVFDKMKIPFSLSSGTCLGWYRQCDIIPYSGDVDVETRIIHYDKKLLKNMRKAKINQLYQFGKEDNGLEFSFLGENRIKLDVFFVFQDGDQYWIGGTRSSDGQRYKYKFPKYELCWTELLEMKVRVPCDPEKYVEAHYGKKWMIPEKKWKWNENPPNIELDGKWTEKDIKEAVQIFRAR